jgi:hypothetical protein
MPQEWETMEKTSLVHSSRLMRLRFVTSESAFDYFRATKDYLEAHSRHFLGDE